MNIHTLLSWTKFISFIGLLGAIYLAVLLVLPYLPIKKNSLVYRKIHLFRERFLIVFPILSVVLLLIYLLFANFKVTAVVLVFIVGVFYNHFSNYIHGLYFKLQPFFTTIKKISYQDVEGTVTKRMFLGVFVENKNGLSFINYKNLYQNGFSIIDESEKVNWVELTFGDQVEQDSIQDALFLHPAVDWEKNPRWSLEENYKKIAFVLKKGAHFDDVNQYITAHINELKK